MKLDTLKKVSIAVLTAGALNLIAAALYILTLPEQVPTHFDAAMVCNGYGSRWTGLFMPAALIIIVAVFLLIYSRSKKTQKNIRVIRLAMLLCSAIIIIATWFVLLLMRSDVQPGEQISRQFWWMFPVLYGVTFIILGNYIPTVRQNRVFGFRSPWTLRNEQCWKLTHQLAGRLSVITGLITLVAAVVMKTADVERMEPYMFVSIGSLMIVVIVPLIYSYCHRAD